MQRDEGVTQRSSAGTGEDGVDDVGEMKLSWGLGRQQGSRIFIGGL